MLNFVICRSIIWSRIFERLTLWHFDSWRYLSRIITKNHTLRSVSDNLLKPAKLVYEIICKMVEETAHDYSNYLEQLHFSKEVILIRLQNCVQLLCWRSDEKSHKQFSDHSSKGDGTKRSRQCYFLDLLIIINEFNAGYIHLFFEFDIQSALMDNLTDAIGDF